MAAPSSPPAAAGDSSWAAGAVPAALGSQVMGSGNRASEGGSGWTSTVAMSGPAGGWSPELSAEKPWPAALSPLSFPPPATQTDLREGGGGHSGGAE